jgi:hypothetical protein
MQMVLAHVQQPIPSAAAIAPHLRPAVDAVFERALAKQADDRPARATEIAGLLAAALR